MLEGWGTGTSDGAHAERAEWKEGRGGSLGGGGTLLCLGSVGHVGFPFSVAPAREAKERCNAIRSKPFPPEGETYAAPL